jgi:two-component system NtrC family response regulator
MLAHAPETKVIVVTGDNERANAVEAVSLGAYDYYQKPVEPDTLRFIVDRAYHVYELEAENRRLQQSHAPLPLEGVVAGSPQMLEVCRMVERVAPTDVTVLLRGGSGTGKERIAQAIHRMSRRSAERIVAINCAAIPASLLEAELFGYEKGAFTGAMTQKIGRIERANGGTLFLDEIGDLPLELQAKLLRFLQERTIERLGGQAEVAVDTRIICATHRNLERMIEEGAFREDLYYRISDVALHIPALKDRDGDAILLAKIFVDRFNAELNCSPRKVLSKDAILAIEAHAWPGNVRELEGRIKRAIIMAAGNQITAADLDLQGNDSEPLPTNLKQAREEAERRVVLRAMAQCNNNISDAANLLGVARPTVYKLIDKYNFRF